MPARQLPHLVASSNASRSRGRAAARSLPRRSAPPRSASARACSSFACEPASTETASRSSAIYRSPRSLRASARNAMPIVRGAPKRRASVSSSAASSIARGRSPHARYASAACERHAMTDGSARPSAVGGRHTPGSHRPPAGKSAGRGGALLARAGNISSRCIRAARQGARSPRSQPRRRTRRPGPAAPRRAAHGSRRCRWSCVRRRARPRSPGR